MSTPAVQQAPAQQQHPACRTAAEAQFVSDTLRRLGEWGAAYQTAGGWRGALAAAREHFADIDRLLELLGSVGTDSSGDGSEGGSGGSGSGSLVAATGDSHSGPSGQLETVARIAVGLTDDVYHFLHAVGLAARLEQPCALLIQRLDAAPDAASTASVQLGTAAVLSCLGACRMRTKRSSAGFEELTRSCELRLDCLGPDHPDTLRAVVAMADGMCECDHHSRAQPFLQRALEPQQRVLGEQHPDAVRTACLLACCDASAGRNEEAEERARRAVQLIQDALGEAHPDSARALLALVHVLAVQGKHAEALTICERALALQREALGEGSEDTISALLAMSECLSTLGRHADAEAAAREAYTLASSVLGDHNATCQALRCLSDSCRQQGRLNEQEQHLRCLLHLQRRVYGPEDEVVARTLMGIADCIGGQGGRLHEAEQLYLEVIKLLRGAYGEEHDLVARCCCILAGVLSMQGRFLEGTAMARRALRTQQYVMGLDHAITHACARTLARWTRLSVDVWLAW